MGTSLDVVSDAPSLDCVYKMQEYAGRARRKRSSGKSTWPGRKQVFRQYDDEGRLVRDVLTVEDDAHEGAPLLEPVMRAGRRLAPAPGLDELRARAARSLETLPASLRGLEPAHENPVAVAPALEALAQRVDREFD